MFYLKLQVMTLTKFKIPKGKHYSRPMSWLPWRHLPHMYIHSGYMVIQAELEITTSMFYDSSEFEDPNDISKLFGLSYGYHMNNSARFGWNCVDGQINIFAFIHDGGKMVMLPMKLDNELQAGDKIHMMIIDERGKSTFYVEGDSITYSKKNRQKKNKFSYELKPYFGGDEPAQHDTYIKLEYL